MSRRKTLDTSHIANELADSVFFRQRSAPPEEAETKQPQPSAPPAEPPPLASAPAPAARPVAKKHPLKAYLTEEQVDLLRVLLFRLNSSHGKIDRSELLGLGVEVLVSMLGTHAPAVDNIDALRALLIKQGMRGHGD